MIEIKITPIPSSTKTSKSRIEFVDPSNASDRLVDYLVKEYGANSKNYIQSVKYYSSYTGSGSKTIPSYVMPVVSLRYFDIFDDLWPFIKDDLIEKGCVITNPSGLNISKISILPINSSTYDKSTFYAWRPSIAKAFDQSGSLKQSLVYHSLFAETIAMLTGKRPLFFNTRAAIHGEKPLFADTRNWLNRGFFANTRTALNIFPPKYNEESTTQSNLS